MGDNKIFYWLKLKDDFFKQKEMKKLRKIAGGDTYTIIYLKMMLLSIKSEGKIYFEGLEDSFAEELALELDEDAENVSIVLKFLEKYKMIEQGALDEYLLPEAIMSIGSETKGAERVRRFRENKKALHCNADVTDVKRLGNTEIEKEIEIELNNKNISVSDFPAENLPVETAQGSDPADEQVSNHSKTQDDVYFNTFWEAYPKRVAKIAAIKAFKKLKMTDDLLQEILKNIEYMKRTREWQEGFVPHPATYLNGERWKDEVVHDKASGITEQSGENEFTGIMSHITRV